MNADQFAYWLQGFAELNDAPPTPEQWQSIREHLQTVFVKVTPAAKLGVGQGVLQCAQAANNPLIPRDLLC